MYSPAPLTYTTVLQRPTAGPSCGTSAQIQNIAQPEIFKPVTLEKRDSMPRVVKALRKGIKKAHAHVAVLKGAVRSNKAKITHQNRLLKEYATRLEQHEKRFDEQSKKIEGLTKELGQFRSMMDRINTGGASENG